MCQYPHLTSTVGIGGAAAKIQDRTENPQQSG